MDAPDNIPVPTPNPPVERVPVGSDDPTPKPGPAKPLVIPPPHESVFRYANKRKRPVNRNVWWRLILRALFSHVGLFCLVSGYAVGGAYLFIAIEQQNEEESFALKKVRYLEVNDSINYLSSLFWYMQTQNMSSADWNNQIYKQLKTFELYIIKSVDERQYDGTYDKWDYDWNFPKSLLLTITSIATIGYGHICPKTPLGRIFCVIYSIIGIPLFFLFLANIGDTMAKWFMYSYSRLCCHWCRMRRKKSEYRKGADNVPVPKSILQTVSTEKVGPENYMPTDTIMVPIMINLVLIGLYIMSGAFLFSSWEKWDMVSAGYFTFITLSTIGFGDLVPGRSFNTADEDGDGESQDFDFSTTLRMLVTCLYCAFGMATVSMCIALVQEQIVYKCRRIGEDIGLINPQPK